MGADNGRLARRPDCPDKIATMSNRTAAAFAALLKVATADSESARAIRETVIDAVRRLILGVDRLSATGEPEIRP